MKKRSTEISKLKRLALYIAFLNAVEKIVILIIAVYKDLLSGLFK